MNELQTTSIKSILPELFRKGLTIELEEELFKDYVNNFFRRKDKILKVTKIWDKNTQEPLLQLKFDDRLNMFFLYTTYDPVLGFYYHKENSSIQLVPFNNKRLLLGVALLIEFTEVIKNGKITEKLINKWTKR